MPSYLVSECQSNSRSNQIASDGKNKLQKTLKTVGKLKTQTGGKKTKKVFHVPHASRSFLVAPRMFHQPVGLQRKCACVQHTLLLNLCNG